MVGQHCFQTNIHTTHTRLYDERRPLEPSYPSVKPSQAEDYPLNENDSAQRDLLHAPPG